MRRLNRVAACQISDRARQLEHAVEGAGGEVELVHGRTQQTLAGRVGGAELADLGSEAPNYRLPDLPVPQSVPIGYPRDLPVFLSGRVRESQSSAL